MKGLFLKLFLLCLALACTFGLDDIKKDQTENEVKDSQGMARTISYCDLNNLRLLFEDYPFTRDT